MKKKKVLWIILFILVLSIAACQKNPERPNVENKSDGELKKAILATEASTTPTAPTEDTSNIEVWQEHFSSKDNTVNIVLDAEIIMPEETKLSVVSCTPHFFTQKEVNQAVKVLFGDAPLFDNSLSDKDWLESEIISKKADLEYLKRNGEYPITERDSEERLVLNVEEEIAWLENFIAELEIDYQAASVTSSSGVEIELKKNDHGGESINVRDDQTPPREFYAVNYKDVNDSAIEYRVTGNPISLGAPLEDSEQIDIVTAREDAEKMALETAAACGVPECKIISTSKIQVDSRPSYLFTMARLIGGIPSIPIFSHDGSLALGTDGKEYREPWRQENIQVVINDEGVVGFRWEYPAEIQSLLNENVAIKSLEEIKETAKKQLQISQTVDQFDPAQKDGKTVQINKVVLNMMRIAEKDSIDQYYYLPVWDFLGSVATPAAAETMEAGERSFITVNAIDGSIIDRGLGY